MRVKNELDSVSLSRAKGCLLGQNAETLWVRWWSFRVRRILEARLAPEELAAYARADATITHPPKTCQEANVVFTAAIAFSIRTGAKPREIYEQAMELVKTNEIGNAVSGL